MTDDRFKQLRNLQESCALTRSEEREILDELARLRRLEPVVVAAVRVHDSHIKLLRSVDHQWPIARQNELSHRHHEIEMRLADAIDDLTDDDLRLVRRQDRMESEAK